MYVHMYVHMFPHFTLTLPCICIAVEEFQKFMHGRGVRREQEMNKLEDHVRQSFKVLYELC